MDKQPPNTPLPTHCLNCGAPIIGPYCAQCGQKNLPRRQTLGELIVNFIGSFTSFESKFFRTIQYLLFRPGFLTIEYNSGRREAYYHPVRAYAFISFIFFLIFFWLTEGVKPNIDVPEDEEINITLNGSVEEAETLEQYDSLQQTLPEEGRDGWLARILAKQEIILKQRYKGRNSEFMTDFSQTFLHQFPKVFFLLLPVFALVLKLLYIRRDCFYSEHLVFSIHYYNFLFLGACIATLMSLVPWLDGVRSFMEFAMVVYLLLAMKKVYQQSWRKTVLKFFMFLFLFGICAIVGLFVNLFVAILII